MNHVAIKPAAVRGFVPHALIGRVLHDDPRNIGETPPS